MIRRIHDKLRPTQGFAHFFHLVIVSILPLLVFMLVRLELFSVALAVILLSKWRIFAIRPRHWLAHLRTNAVDIIFSVSILAFMVHAPSIQWQIFWVIIYEIWVLFIKPGSRPLFVTMQSVLAQTAGLTALFVAFPTIPLSVLILGAALVAYFSARHFFGSFEEPYSNIYAWAWTLFGACLTWVLGHWLLFYGPIAQLTVILTIISSSLAALYYLSETDKLSKLIQRQLVFVTVAAIVVMLVLSDWGARII